ncbi:methyltransferase [Candidatus Woesearchaeota archaeon]|nr:methyltransferase [Candidatus Woesearchaeota archaeon]
MITKSRLAIELSKLNVFRKANITLEQYPTDSEIAASVLWQSYMQGELQNKIVADLGCGTGILGIGALLLGAKYVYFVDVDKEALLVLRENLKRLCIEKNQYSIQHKDILQFKSTKNIDLIIQNPPFGTRNKHIDKVFLEKAMSLTKIIYSFHKLTSKQFIAALCKDHNFSIKDIIEFDFPLKYSQKFHNKRIQYIAVGCWKLVKDS